MYRRYYNRLYVEALMTYIIKTIISMIGTYTCLKCNLYYHIIMRKRDVKNSLTRLYCIYFYYSYTHTRTQYIYIYIYL